MAEKQHLTLEQRISIQEMLQQKKSFREMAGSLGKAPSTVSREIRSRLIRRRTGCMGMNYNACMHRYQCKKSKVCAVCHSMTKYRLCRRCPMCNTFCSSFVQVVCKDLSRPPYVCNGCGKRTNCTLEKRFYDAKAADMAYHSLLSDGRSGISLSEEELRHLDETVSPLIRQNQSPHHVCAANRDSILVSERTVYRYIDARILSARNIDLSRKVRFRARKKTVHAKVDRKCRTGRTYQDFLSYIKEHPDVPVTELDSVEGKKGGKVLLTIHFRNCGMMLAFIRDHNDSASVIRIFEELYETLGRDRFMKIFKVCLADNGSEFSNPGALEYDREGRRRTNVFYCDPQAPFQKGSAERNHEFIRCFLPKGEDMSPYLQEDITTMMDNINSYRRASLADKCPYDVFTYFYGEEYLQLLCLRRIEPNAVVLNRSVFRKEADHG